MTTTTTKPQVITSLRETPYRIVFSFMLLGYRNSIMVNRGNATREYHPSDKKLYRLMDRLQHVPGAVRSIHPIGLSIGFKAKGGELS